MPKIHSIAIASDHAGYDLKETLCDHLKENGHQVENLGTDSTDSTDYSTDSTDSTVFFSICPKIGLILDRPPFRPM